jgi:hypothetical protein
MLSDWGSEPETFARWAKLKPPVRLVRGPRVRIDGATSSRSHRDRADLGTHLSPEHRNSYVRDSDVHQTFSPLRDDNTTEALYPPAVSLSTPKFSRTTVTTKPCPLLLRGAPPSGNMSAGDLPHIRN